MTLDQFWEIIAHVRRESGRDFRKKCESLDGALLQLPLAEVLSFDAHFTDCLDRAYTWELWAAAYIIGGGCSDDSFWDFRSTLISMGRDIFERALADPESLADTIDKDEELHCEGFQYVAPKVARELSGGEEFARSKPHPKAPSGREWNPDTLVEMYPRLARKFEFR